MGSSTRSASIRLTRVTTSRSSTTCRVPTRSARVSKDVPRSARLRPGAHPLLASACTQGPGTKPPYIHVSPVRGISMRSILVGAIGTCAVLAAAPAGNAQGPGDHEHGTQDHGLGKLGKVTFTTSCAPEAGRRFERAMAVLHSFWWEEGDAAFNRVLEADSECAMAYWGLAMNAWGNPFAGGPSGAVLTRGAEAASKAASLSAGTPREQGFIAAVAALYRDPSGTPNAGRLQAYADTMARLHRDFPKDSEVATYYALALVATAPKTD